MKVNFSQVFAGQKVGIKQVEDNIWLISFMEYDSLPDRRLLITPRRWDTSIT